MKPGWLTSRTSSVERFLWARLPLVSGSPTVNGSLADGRYLTALPGPGVIAPLAGFGVGFAVGWQRPETQITYTYSILWLGLMVAVAAFGAHVGWWITVGFVLGDLTLRDPIPWFFQRELEWMTGTRLVTYIVLWALLVYIPYAASVIPVNATRVLRVPAREAAVARAVALPVLASVFTWLWTEVTPVLIRPLFTSGGQGVAVEAISPLQNHGGRLVAVAAIAAVARVLLEFVAFSYGGRPVPSYPAAAVGRGSALVFAGFAAFLLLAHRPAYGYRDPAFPTWTFAHGALFWLAFLFLLAAFTLGTATAFARGASAPSTVRSPGSIVAACSAAAAAFCIAALATKNGIDFEGYPSAYADGGLLALVAVALVGLGGLAMMRDEGLGLSVPIPASTLSVAGRLAGWAAKAALLTVLFYGFIATLTEAAIIFAIAFAGLAWRGLVAPQIPRYSEVLNRIPVLIRLVVCFVVAYFATRGLVTDAFNEGQSSLRAFNEGQTSFRAYLYGLAISFGLAALLLPERPRPLVRSRP